MSWRRIASHLNFTTPDALPDGFNLQAVCDLRIGSHVGIAVHYDREGEFLAVVFHPPTKHERFGSHRDYPCVVGPQSGKKVEVGGWKPVPHRSAGGVGLAPPTKSAPGQPTRRAMPTERTPVRLTRR